MSDGLSKSDKLSPDGWSSLFSAAAVITGCFGGLSGFHEAGQVLQLGGAALGIAKEFADRKSKAKIRRLELNLRQLDRRLNGVDASQSEKNFDLFVEVLRRAVEDDEDSKHVFYSGILEWIAREKPPLSQVRVLGNAVQSLAFIELNYFVRQMHSLEPGLALKGQIEEAVVHARLESCGLSNPGMVRYRGSPTSLGQVLKKYCDPSEISNAERLR